MKLEARAGEIFSLEWKDVDLENKILSITLGKNSNPHLFKMSKAG
jgi:integrase